MKKIVLSIVVVASVGSSVFAAPFSWTGFYGGATLGVPRTESDVSLNTVNGASALYNPADIPHLNAFGSANLNDSNFITGGKLGYNQQLSAWVVGLEGDFSYLQYDKTATASGNPFFATFAGGSGTLSENVSTHWLATVRPRLGYAAERTLLFVTGGLAVGRIGFSNNYRGFSPAGSGFEFESSADSQNKAGWSVGTGLDYALTDNWILSGEYIHIDLGTVSTSGVVTTGNPNTATMNYSTKVRSDIGRVGIAYKF